MTHWDLDKSDYGLELVNIYFDITSLLAKIPLKSFRKEIIDNDLVWVQFLNKKKNNYKEVYIEHYVRERILNFCKYNDIDFEDACQHGDEIFVPLSEFNSFEYITLKLIACDVNKIKQILNWNKYEFEKKENRAKEWKDSPFVMLVEHFVYGTVAHSSPAKDDERLKTIFSWIDENKSEILYRGNQAIAEPPISETANVEKTENHSINEPIYYCKYDPELLDVIIPKLISIGVMSKNNANRNSFKYSTTLEENKMEWQGSEPQCFYLLWLLNGGHLFKNGVNSIRIEKVAQIIFNFPKIKSKRTGKNILYFLGTVNANPALDTPERKRISSIFYAACKTLNIEPSHDA